MLRIVKYMKGYGNLVALIVVLLVVQAFCDLALPQYTSDIIDNGIQNKGVIYVLPEKILAVEFEAAQMVMTKEEIADWKDSYKENGEIYERKDISKKRLEELNEEFSVPLLVYAQTLSMRKETKAGQQMPEGALAGIRGKVEEQCSTIGESLVYSTVMAYTASVEEAAGIDMEKKQKNYLWLAGGKMLIVAFLMALVSSLVCLYSAKIGAGVGRDLRGKIYSKVMRFSDAEMGKYSTASLITRSTNDVQQIQMVETMLLRMIIYAPIIGIGGIIKVIQTGSGMGWIIVLAVVLLFALVMALLKLAMPKFKKMQTLVDRINLISREILTGLSVIRAFGREKREEERFEEANTALTRNMLFTNRVMTFMMPCMMFIMYGISILIVWVAAGKIDQGQYRLGR